MNKCKYFLITQSFEIDVQTWLDANPGITVLAMTATPAEVWIIYRDPII